MIEKIWTVQESRLLARLSHSELVRLEYQSKARSLPPNFHFPFPEHASDSAFLVVSGRLLARFFADSRSQPVAVELTPGDFFGVTPGETAASAGGALELAERSTIVAIPREVFRNSLNAQRRLQNHVFSWSHWSLRHFSVPVADNFFISTQKRLARLLYDQATARPEAASVAMPGVTPAQLARLVNSATEIVEATLDDWERDEVIHRPGGRIEITDLSTLADAGRLELREPIRTSGNTVRVVR